MATRFPLEYSLENGTRVVVQKQADELYVFTLTPTEGNAHTFTYRDGTHTKAEWDALLNFEQLDALREFWLKTDDVV